ncbi:unnamed protein product [Zymoseptoria tritici ST99CH_1A5]|uniref:Uncharacterized protein n=1 Tax=Zymoseptoria tritici ST99CH_1A5 TaxID=1276529 RepID=A0A1Y6LRM7_ZYMTR|nr:unnamed protein product [Zymoseptoria tritici ST99CH_1A5]
MNSSSTNSNKRKVRPLPIPLTCAAYQKESQASTTAPAPPRPTKLVKLPVSVPASALTTTTAAATAAKPAKKQLKKEKKTAVPAKHEPKEVNAVIGEPVKMPRVIPAATLLKGLEQLYLDNAGMWHRKKRIVTGGGEVRFLTESEEDAAAALTSLFAGK